MSYKQAEIERLVEDQKSSGVSVREFYKARGLDRNIFYVWRQRAREGVEKFARVETSKRIELELSGGAIVRVSPEDLKAVLEALR